MIDPAACQLSCVLPAYNEQDSLAATVARWAALLPRFAREHEIIVVDDGSVDGTAAAARELAGRHERVRVITHPVNLGYGAAIANGFADAAFPLLFFTDADGQYAPEDVGLLLAHIARADLVVGYRVRRADPGLRRPLSRGYNFVARHTIGVALRDINCAFKLMHRETFRRLQVESRGFCFNAELAANARTAGMRIVEVPVRHLPREAGRSTVRPSHILSSFWELVRLRARQRARARSSLRTAPIAADPAAVRIEESAIR